MDLENGLGEIPLMDLENGLGAFDRVTLKGRNVGASMLIHHGKNEHSDGCCINIYVNNNIQGVNNSLVIDSQVEMRDPGVFISLENLNRRGRKQRGVLISLENFNRRRRKKLRELKRKPKSDAEDSLISKLGFPSIFVAFTILLLLFISMS